MLLLVGTLLFLTLACCPLQSDVDRAAAGTGQTIATTGGHVWDAARRMAEFLEASEEELQLRRAG